MHDPSTMSWTLRMTSSADNDGPCGATLVRCMYTASYLIKHIWINLYTYKYNLYNLLTYFMDVYAT